MTGWRFDLSNTIRGKDWFDLSSFCFIEGPNREDDQCPEFGPLTLSRVPRSTNQLKLGHLTKFGDTSPLLLAGPVRDSDEILIEMFEENWPFSLSSHQWLTRALGSPITPPHTIIAFASIFMSGFCLCHGDWEGMISNSKCLLYLRDRKVVNDHHCFRVSPTLIRNFIRAQFPELVLRCNEMTRWERGEIPMRTKNSM